MSAPEVVAVLVIPAEGDPGGLLAVGPLGARPPCVVNYPKRGPDTDPLWSSYAIPTVTTSEGQVRALPLAWDGALVPQGWDGLTRALNPKGRGRHLDPHWSAWYAAHRWYPSWYPSLSQMLALAEFAVSAGLASRVVRLARVEGRLVEVQP